MTEEHKIVRPNNIDELVTSENLATIRYWKRHGFTNDEVAKSCGIARSTLQRWATQNPLLKEALKIGKEQAIAVVENKLFTKALQGNMTAIIFWLKNNARNLYNDSQLSKEELQLIKARIRNANAEAEIKEAKARILKDNGQDVEQALDKMLDVITREDKKDGSG